MKTTVLRRAMGILLSAALVTSFVPAQGLADSVSLAGPSVEASASSDGRLDGGSGSPSAADAIVTADSTATGAAPDDAAGAPALANDAAAAPAPGASESDGAGAPAPAGPASAPLVNIIEADAAGNPHAQMYTTLLDKDGKVVDTNDPSRTVDQRYKPVDQGGEGAGLAKGDGVTVHFRMAAVTPNNADGEGTGVQEDTTYLMELPWQLVAAKQDKSGNKLIDSDVPLDFFNSGDMTAKGGVYSRLGSDGAPLANSTGDPLYELRVDFANVADRVDIAGEFQYTTTVSQNVTSGSTVSLTYVPGGTVSFKVNDDPTPGVDGEYGATISAGSGGPTSYYVNASLSKNALEGSTDDVFAYKNATISLDDNMGVWVDENAWAQTAPAEGNVFNAYGDNSGPYFSLGVTYSEKTEGGSNKSAWVTADSSSIIENANGRTVVRFSLDGLQVDVAFSTADALEGSLIRADRQSYIAKRFTLSVTDGAGNEAKGIKALNLYVPTVLASDYVGTSTNAQLSLHAIADSLDALDATGSLNVDLGRFEQPSGSTSTFNPASGLEFVNSAVCAWLGSNTSSYKGNYYWLDFDPAVYNDAGVNFYASMASFLPGKELGSNYRWLDNSGGYAMSDGTASTFMTGGAGPGTQIVGMTGLNYWQFVGTVSVGQVKGDSNLVSNSCFASGSDGGSRGDAKLQYQLKKVFADADSSQQLVVYRSVDQNGNLMRNSYGDVMYIVVDPRTNANAQRQQDISGQNWYNYRDERSNSMGSAKGGSWRLHVFNAPQSTLQMTFPQYEGSFDVSDQARSGGHISDRVQVGNGSFNAESRTSNELSYGVNTQQSSYMNAEWVDDTTIFWSMTMNVDNWQRWTDGKLYVSADRPLQVVSAPSGVKVSGQDVSGGYAFAKTSNGWESVASGMSTGFYQASWDQMCDGATIEQKSGNNNFSIRIERNAFDVDSSTGNKTITVGFFTKVTDRSVQSDDSFRATAQLVCHTGDATLIAGNGHCAWPTSANGTTAYGYGLGQWAYRVSATAATHTPSLYKYSNEAVSASDPANIATSWTLAANNFNTNGNHYTHTNSPLVNAYYGGWTGRFAIGDTMNGSKVTDADGNEVNVNAGRYTHVTRMFPSKYPSVSENRNGGGCGPIPAKGMGGDSWEKYVDGAWKATNPENCYWESDAPGVYRKILTTSSGGGTSNSEANPMAVYVYYAGNMADSIFSTVGGSTLNSVGANVGDPTYSTSSLAIEYRGLEQVESIGNNNQLDYQTELDTKELVAAAAAAQGKAGVDAATALYNVQLKNAAGFGTWRITSKDSATSMVSKAVTAGLSIKKEATGPAAANDDNGGLYASYKIDTQVGFSPSAFVNIEDHISKVVDSGNVSNGSGAVTYDVSDTAAATQQDKDAVAALKKATSLKNLKVTVTEPGQPEQEIGTYDEETGIFTFKDGWKSSVLNFGDYAEQPGALFNGQITRDADSDGNPQLLSAQTKISITYDLYLDIDAKTGGDMSFRESEYYHGGALTETNEQGGKDVYAAGPGFTITASDLPFDSYLASTYSMDIDWEGFFQDAAEKGLLDGAGNAMGANRAPELTVKNQVVGDRNQKADSSAGEIKIESATFGKSIKDVDASVGTATWQLSAKTSDSVDPSELVFNDEPTFSADDEAAATAAKSATSIEDVVVSLGGTVLYENGALTDEAVNDGWTDGNVSVAIDGTRLSITIKNIDGARVLAKGQSYEVTYRTVLDKNAFVAALVKAGGTAANAAYCIQNVASLSSGGAVLSGGSNASFTPSIPVTAEKSAATTPQGGLETQSASFTVKAGTGEVPREGFTLTDQIRTMYGYNDSAAAAQKAMMLSALSAKVTLADGSEEVLDAARILSGEVAGVSLAMADGSELALNVPGSFGNNRGWKLTFDKLPAGATVTVDYTLTVDRAAYVAAGGDLDSVVTFRNAFAVSTADGSTAEDSSTGKVKVQPDVSKKGVVSSSKSEDGNPLINWSVDVRLQQIFGAVELSTLETASIKDVLDQRLKYLGVSVEDSRTTIDGTTTTPLEEGRDYEASFDEATRTLEVKIKNPSEHPDVRVTIKTEVVGSVDGIGNSVDVFVDGQYKGGDKTEIKDDLVAVTAYGSVISAKAPTWAASALKLVDGGQGETPAGAFTFSLVQVDESGNPIEGGQSAEAVNGADGAISFDAITYGPRNIAGTYWYQITEKSTDELAAIYKMDDSVKTVKVTLQKGTDGDYLLSCEVVDGGDGAAADSVVFNNETIPEVPDNPDKPDTPEVPDSPDAPQAPEAPGDENVLSKTGDGAPTALLLALALGGLGLAAIARRLRRE